MYRKNTFVWNIYEVAISCQEEEFEKSAEDSSEALVMENFFKHTLSILANNKKMYSKILVVKNSPKQMQITEIFGFSVKNNVWESHVVFVFLNA